MTKRWRDERLKLSATIEVFVPVTVILEAECVLRDAYELPRDQVIRELRRFCGLERVTVGAADAVGVALEHAERGLDLADAPAPCASERLRGFSHLR